MKRIVSCLFMLSTFFSCSTSDDSQSQIDQSEANFYALSVGNSWVYKNYKYNSETSEYDFTGVIDSVSVLGVKDIEGESFYMFRRLTTGNENGITFCNPNGEHFEYYREFEGDLIKSDGSIKFSLTNFDERLLFSQEGADLDIYETFINGEIDIEVEAGEFSCVYSERYAKNKDEEQLPGLDRFYYADSIGLIYDTSSFASIERPVIIRRLDSYDLK